MVDSGKTHRRFRGARPGSYFGVGLLAGLLAVSAAPVASDEQRRPQRVRLEAMDSLGQRVFARGGIPRGRSRDVAAGQPRERAAKKPAFDPSAWLLEHGGAGKPAAEDAPD